MSPFRIVLSFAIAGLALYQGYSHPNMRAVWYMLAAWAFFVGVIRVMRNRKAAAQRGQDSDAPK